MTAPKSVRYYSTCCYVLVKPRSFYQDENYFLTVSKLNFKLLYYSYSL